MKTIVIYDSTFGNTAKVARVITDTLRETGDVQIIAASYVTTIPTSNVDLLVVGGPTQAHSDTSAIEALFFRVPERSLRGVAVATFDTRLRWPKMLSGSAAEKIARRLRRLGAILVLPPESFFVEGREGPLEDGEAERATAWAHSLATELAVQPAR